MIDFLHSRLGWPKVILWVLWPVLWLLSVLFRAVIWVKNVRWDSHPPSRIGQSFVVSIGNISAGGTGKTPLGLRLLGWLEEKGLKTEVILRGYGAKDGLSDEAQLYRRALSDEKVHQEADRVLGLKEMVSEDTDVVLLDDAFQHRRAGRDIDLVLWDLSAPSWESKMMPLGLLREPMNGLKRANAVIFTRSEKCSEEEKQNLVGRFKKEGWGKEHYFATSQPKGLIEWPSDKLVENDGRPCFLVSGIGRPESFLSTAQRLHLNVVGHRWFPDHYPYEESDCEDVWRQAEEVGADQVVVTSKDIVKWRGKRSVWVLELEMKIEDAFWSWFEKVLNSRRV